MLYIESLVTGEIIQTNVGNFRNGLNCLKSCMREEGWTCKMGSKDFIMELGTTGQVSNAYIHAWIGGGRYEG